jgi:hypothetical protein
VGILLMAIGGYSINDYWLLFYKQLLVVIILMIITWYYINGYQWIFYWWILVFINWYNIIGFIKYFILKLVE